MPPEVDLSRHFNSRALEVCRLLCVRPHDVLTRRTRSGMVLVEDILEYASKRGPLRNVATGPKLACLTIRDDVVVRKYQREACQQALGRSGFVVAPCAAGKTLIGLLIAALNGGRVLLLTTRYADQWRTTIERMFDLVGRVVVCMLGDVDDHRLPPHVVIGTYAGFAAKPRSDRQRLVRLIPYQTVVLDEAHGAASPSNLALIDALNYRYAIALTATKVREDNELEKLERRIGSTLVDVDRMTLVAEGHVADVECINLLVPCSGVEFEDGVDIPLRVALAIDPNKMRLLSKVLATLSADGHRVLVFCDDLFCLRWTRSILNRSCPSIVGTISMETPDEDRKRLIAEFRDEARPTTALFISRTGDEALDIPEASAAIVFCNNWGSRRQLVQRLGRLARKGGIAPVFVVLVAEHEKELSTSKHREDYARAHGFSFSTRKQEETRYSTTLVGDTSRYAAALVEEWRSRRQRRAER